MTVYRFVRFWSHRSRSCQSLPYCSSWWVCTSPRPHWWRGWTTSLWSLRKSKKKKLLSNWILHIKYCVKAALDACTVAVKQLLSDVFIFSVQWFVHGTTVGTTSVFVHVVHAPRTSPADKGVLPVRRVLCVDICSVLSGQFHFSRANWCLHSWIPLWAPTCTLLA